MVNKKVVVIKRLWIIKRKRKCMVENKGWCGSGNVKESVIKGGV